MERPGNYREFWPIYVNAHRSRMNRALHMLGTTLAFLTLLGAAMTGNWIWVVAAPILGYGCAWIGHFFFEHNRPATFGAPFYSLRGDFQMYWLTLSGRMEAELRRIRPDRNIH